MLLNFKVKQQKHKIIELDLILKTIKKNSLYSFNSVTHPYIRLISNNFTLIADEHFLNKTSKVTVFAIESRF